mmetsp:Transcript_121056/g.302085  ORF Transcript_121056/g.302085 Transcript_121056/m.302085 type:complete len:213 (+) Transcript_121056:1183-1821(+)
MRLALPGLDVQLSWQGWQENYHHADLGGLAAAHGRGHFSLRRDSGDVPHQHPAGATNYALLDLGRRLPAPCLCGSRCARAPGGALPTAAWRSFDGRGGGGERRGCAPKPNAGGQRCRSPRGGRPALRDLRSCPAATGRLGALPRWRRGGGSGRDHEGRVHAVVSPAGACARGCVSDSWSHVTLRLRMLVVPKLLPLSRTRDATKVANASLSP